MAEWTKRDLIYANLIALIIILYVVGGAIYRLKFSPLAKFPGPKLAALTYWYEFYHDVIRRGQYTFEIWKMHERYGPIVRISPYQLHINDPDYYDELYSQTSPRNKWSYYTESLGHTEAAFSTLDHYQHRLRRSPLNPFFSKRRILGLEGLISSMIEKLCARLEEFRRSGQPLRIRLAYTCLTMDIITKYAMARSWDHLDTPDFSPTWYEIFKTAAGATLFMRHFPWLYSVMKALPDRVVDTLTPGMSLVNNFHRAAQRQVKEIMEGKEDKESDTLDGQPTIFHHLLNSDIPPEEKSFERLWQEAVVILGAGAETTANTLDVLTFHLLDNPEKLKRLKSELETVMPHPSSPVKLQQLEQLPYLSAVLNEGLRLSYGVSQRLQRIAPNEALRFHDWTIPAGTPVGMTSVLIHHNEFIFPNSHTFLPERWFKPAPDGRPLDRYLVSFTKGSRQCLGINLARAELYLTIAHLFRRFDMQLFETDRSDVDIKYDLFLPQPKIGSKGVRVLIK